MGLGQHAEFTLKYGHQENEEGRVENSALTMFDLRCLWMICLNRKLGEASEILFTGEAVPHEH